MRSLLATGVSPNGSCPARVPVSCQGFLRPMAAGSGCGAPVLSRCVAGASAAAVTTGMWRRSSASWGTWTDRLSVAPAAAARPLNEGTLRLSEVLSTLGRNTIVRQLSTHHRDLGPVRMFAFTRGTFTELL